MASIAILTLGLCFGTNLTIFAIVDAMLVKALPYPEPDRLVVIHNAYPKSGVERGKATVTNYFERRGAIEAFDSLAMIQPESYFVGEADSTRRVDTGMITHEFFETLGFPLAIGQTFTDAEYDYGPDKVAIITDRFLKRRREVGVRMALGAGYQQIVNRILRMGLHLLVVGALIGSLAAGAVGRVMQSILFDVPSLHPANLALTVVLMGLVTLLACVLPARRACQVSPMEALKIE